MSKDKRDSREIIAKLMSGRPGMRARVNAKCVDCIYDPLLPGNWKQQVHACEDDLCPLWEIRAKSASPLDIGKEDGQTTSRYAERTAIQPAHWTQTDESNV